MDFEMVVAIGLAIFLSLTIFVLLLLALIEICSGICWCLSQIKTATNPKPIQTSISNSNPKSGPNTKPKSKSNVKKIVSSPTSNREQTAISFVDHRSSDNSIFSIPPPSYEFVMSNKLSHI